MYEHSLFIFRRDLRIQDNKALIEACRNSKVVYPIFIFTPEQVGSGNKFRSDNAIQFMIESLSDLQSEIKRAGGTISFFYDSNEDIVKKLIGKLKLDAIYFNADISPYAKKRDAAIQKLCIAKKVECISTQDYYLHDFSAIKTGGGTTYTKFTPFYNKASKLSVDKPLYLKAYNFSKQSLNNLSLNEMYTRLTKPNEHKLVVGGRANAMKIVNSLSKFSDYEKVRNDLTDETTLLSAYIKFGCVSIREIYHKMRDKLGKGDGLIRQLYWRDFYANILYEFPQVLGSSMKPKYDGIKWTKNAKLLRAWKEGKTGFPIVDAGMRELNTTGYMHNRARLITASFLIKTMLIDWQEGEKYFAQQLSDYDPASNNGNWQWVASTGADSQPYFRIFNPWSQSEKHDKDAVYIKKWVHELADVPAKDIHKWDEKCKDFKNINYPCPIVSYEDQRKKALSMYKKVV